MGGAVISPIAIHSDDYLSHNKHFCICVLRRYTQYDFENWVASSGITYHEKTLGQLFCDKSSKEIVKLLLNTCEKYSVSIKLKTSITAIEKKDDQFSLSTSAGNVVGDALVIATGGLSFPTMGASPFGYRIAEQFGLRVLPVRAALVPFTLHKKELDLFDSLSGVTVDVVVSSESRKRFREAMLFTHRGLSGPAILQTSSYWQPGEAITINYFPDGLDIEAWQTDNRDTTLKSLLNQHLAKSLVQVLCDHWLENKPMKQYSLKELQSIEEILTHFGIKPNGTEGYRTAEVTLGGVDTNELSSKTFETKKVSGLYFIGEVIDVTGHLGGFNFQ